jgi:hypothetical protein
VVGDALVVDVGGRRLTLDREFLSQLTAHGDPVVSHGYAITGHVAQGLTAERAFVLGSDVMYREWVYTAMSRGRTVNRLYMVGSGDQARDEIAPVARASTDEELRAALRRSEAKAMALDVSEIRYDTDGVRVHDLARERARLERRLDRLEEPPRKRWWRRRRPDQRRGARALIENRLAEIDVEVIRLQFTPERRAADCQARLPGRELDHNVIER